MSKIRFTIALGLALSGFSGCASWTSSKSGKKESMWTSMQFWKKPYQKPQKMAAIWSPDVLTMSGKAPTRGFGGRIYFYNEKSQAIAVDGELVVHGYLEKRVGKTLQTEKVEADKTFVFNAEQFTEHFSPSDMGASYSVWIPWDAAGGLQSEITLIPTFKGTDGSLVQGEPAKLVLPGKKKEEPASTPFQNVSYQQATAASANTAIENPAMRTTTISIPARTQRHDRDSVGMHNDYGLPTPVTVGVKSTAFTPTVDPNRALVYGGTAQVNRGFTLTPTGIAATPSLPTSYPGVSGMEQANIAPTTGIMAPGVAPLQTTPVNYPVGPTYPPAPMYQPAPGFQQQRTTPGLPVMPQMLPVPPGSASPTMPLPYQAGVSTQGDSTQAAGGIQVAPATNWQPFGQATRANVSVADRANVSALGLVQPAGFTTNPGVNAMGPAQSPVQPVVQPSFHPVQQPIYSR